MVGANVGRGVGVTVGDQVTPSGGQDDVVNGVVVGSGRSGVMIGAWSFVSGKVTRLIAEPRVHRCGFSVVEIL